MVFIKDQTCFGWRPSSTNRRVQTDIRTKRHEIYWRSNMFRLAAIINKQKSADKHSD